MKTYEVKAIELATGITRHITGKWSNVESMENELTKDGYIVTWYAKK